MVYQRKSASYDSVFLMRYRKRYSSEVCRRCKVAFKVDDRIHVQSVGHSGKRIFHSSCWEALFV